MDSTPGLARTALALLASMVFGSAQAAMVDIVNHSFENDPAAPNTFPTTFAPDGWSFYDPNQLIGGNNAVGVIDAPVGSEFFPGGVPDGEQAALIYLAGSDGSGQPGEREVGITQELSALLTANTRYTLQVDIGNIASGTGSPPFDAFGFFDLRGFPGYRTELLAGGIVIAFDDNSLGGSLPDGTFATSTLQVDIGATHAQLGAALEIRLINLNIPGTADAPGIEVDFDNVRLDASPVPLPGAVYLLGSVLLLPLLRTRRRRQHEHPR
ncbi:MAG: hypothetical protein KDK91_31185 [Gammaproteobacteria bacterium]|nr:hypothetical protein [Gammaproteobacteria bacterium]